MKNADAVCLACFKLEGSLKSVDLEHIALVAYELAPLQFGWNHYPDRIDLRKVQYALKNEVLNANPRLTGSVKEGYQLTPLGLEWSRNMPELRRDDETTDQKQVIPKIGIERRRLRSSAACRKYFSGVVDTITRQDFDAFVRINDYFPEALRAQRIAKIDNIVAGDVELEKVWNLMKARFGGEEYA